MKRPLGAALCLLLLGAAPAPPLAPADVLANYARALELVPHPPAIEFEYAVEQLGLHNIEQTHHVYRAGQSERDEIRAVDGQTLTKPSVRIILNRTYRYDISQIAPRPDEYTFTYAGSTTLGPNHYAYEFKTEAHQATGFAVDAVTIDGLAFLPSTIHFRIAGDSAHGSGRLLYGKADRYWLVREASVSAHVPNGGIAHETIVWSRYQFPPELPPSTFNAPATSAE